MKARLSPMLIIIAILAQATVVLAEEEKPLQAFLSLYQKAKADNTTLKDYTFLAKPYNTLKKSGEAEDILSSASEDELKQLTIAFTDMMRLSDTDGVSRWILTAVKELHARGSASESDLRLGFKSLIYDREFSKAREFRRDFSLTGLPEVPRIHFMAGKHDDLKIRYWEVDPERRVLSQRQFEFAGPQVIIVTHPAVCAPSRRATKEFYEDPLLRSVMAEHGLFLVPALFGLHFDYIQAWNKIYTENSLVIAHSERDWPMLDLNTTPVFYFFMDDTLVDRVIGWPSGGNKEAILDGLKTIGLLEPGKEQSR